MSELFKVNTPLPSQDANRMRPQGPTPSQINVLNVPDPTRVTQPSQQNEINADRDPNKFLPNLESNYEKFLQTLRSSPDSVSLYETLFFTRMGNIVSSGISEGLAAEISEYLEMLQMNEAELLGFIKGQLSSSVKFNGPVFNILRDAFAGTNSSTLQYSIIEMLRHYDSMTSTQHILDQLLINLQGMAERMPENRANELTAMIDALIKEHANGQSQTNIDYIKSEIIPFLSQYISSRADYGAFRDLVTMFTLNLARYENGSTESFLASFRNLMTYEEISGVFPGVDQNELEQYMISSHYQKNEIVDKFISVLSRGIAGESGIANRPVFENMLQSMLINESVYMPLLHAVIPAELFGNLFYGEMWIDPNSDEGASQNNPDAPAVKILMKFDIKNVGYFEMILLSRDKSVDMNLFYPEHLDSSRREFRTAINEIMNRNGLTVTGFMSAIMTVPKTVSEVFPKIYERKNSINVLI